MQNYKVIVILGVIEIIIGVSALLSNITMLAFDVNEKSFNVLFFVLTAAAISTLLGIGILKLNRLAYQLLLYFSTVIILSKFLIFMGIIQLNGELEVTMHDMLGMPVSEDFRRLMNGLKGAVSAAYHGWIIHFLSQPNIKNIFIRS